MATSSVNLPKEATISKWKKDFPWLQVKNGHMFCDLFSKWENRLRGYRNYNDTFCTKGSSNWRRSALSDHDTSTMHKEVVEHEKRQNLGESYRRHVVQTIPDDNPLKKHFEKMSESARKAMERSFEVADFIGKKGKPFSDYPGWSLGRCMVLNFFQPTDIETRARNSFITSAKHCLQRT